jgi:hypothetical protein
MNGTRTAKFPIIRALVRSFDEVREGFTVRPGRFVWFLGLMFLAFGCCEYRSMGTVSATTGNTAAAVVPAHFKVPRQIAKLYPGQYLLRSIASGARLSRVQMVFEINALGYLQGVGSFYGYNAQGFQTSWVATFYNFHLTAPGRMAVEIFDVTGTRVFGHLYIRRTKQGNLQGQIALPKTPYAIEFQRRVGL